ncbi:MAG: glycoside hydrolase family 25 protein [Bacteroidales bacterium]|nr:glycoside hydrolase family 25 protein [Lachnoclostridium sp.]MCM1385622.1 glycoside hydrolase family 25 protein [Lachnoclostridium sp.]MCM1466431.1 glycoside hydrolase family 25 protein [Bacteroidales bacterium]
MNQQNMTGKPKKKSGVARYFLTLGGYLAALVVVLYIMGVASSWLDGRINKVQEDAAEAANMSNVQNDVPTVYSQEELDTALNNALAEAQQAASARVEQAVLSKEEEILGGIKTSLLEGEGLLDALRPYYPDEIVLASNGSYHFVPINKSLQQNSWMQENLQILESGEYQYLQDGEIISHKGIDVSAHQGKIDWQKVSDDGVEFAFIRAAFRGYGTGKLVEDTKFEENIKNATAAGVNVGVYVYSQAVTEEEILEEADFLMKKAAPYGTDIPIVIDVEKVDGDDGRMNALSMEERTNLVLLFCQTVENAGYKPMIYHNTEMGALMLDISALENYPKWFASYSNILYYPYAYGIWQYSNKGRVDGIKGNVDLNISFTKFWEE